MSNLWDKFDKEFGGEEFKKEVENAGTGEYKEVPHGEYEVKIDTMELRASKKGDPMVTIWFKIINGDFKNSLIFMNQVINIPFQVSLTNKLLKDMMPDEEITFESYSQYGNLIADLFEKIEGNYEFALEYGEKKGFSTFKIIDVFPIA